MKFSPLLFALLLAQPVAAQTVASHLAQGRIIAAHRSWLSPDQLENDLSQMRQTAQRGPFMLEMDLRTSRDGTIFMLHDTTVDRTTDGHGAIAQLSDLAIEKLHLRAPDGQITSDPIPRFADVAAMAESQPGTMLMLDIKAADYAKIFAIVRQHHLANQVVALTFTQANTQAALQAGPDILVVALVHSPAEIAEIQSFAPSRRLGFYVPQQSDPSLFAAARASGGVVITDAIMYAPGGSLDHRAEANGDQLYRDFLSSRPIDVFVTNHPEQVSEIQEQGK